MRVVFFGSSEFATPTLQRLIESRHEVALVTTQPDRPAGRGRQLTPTPVKRLALEHGLRVETPEKLRGANYHETLEALEPEVGVVASYGLVLPKAVLDAPRHGCLNVHSSLLPRWRGAAPVQRAILAGDRRTGVTIMKMDEGLDTGEIVAREEMEILDDDDTLSVTNALSMIGADLLVKVLGHLEQNGELRSKPQDESRATPAPKIKKEEGWIDWRRDADAIICQIHALRDWPGAFSRLRGKLVKIIEAEPERAIGERVHVDKGEARPGVVVGLIKKLGPIVRVGDGHLILTKVKPESKKPMSGAAWINGGGVKVGDVFQS